jgi:hypothetical protein
MTPLPYAPPLTKPEPRKRAKARKKRVEANYAASIRAEVVSRDGHCRLLGTPFGACQGRSTWNHWRRRSQTRGMSPEDRHTTMWTFMACREHHRQVDEHEITVEALNDVAGADWRLRFKKGDVVWTEESA